jgi:N-sulfoglucosamine sulfohydrolase
VFGEMTTRGINNGSDHFGIRSIRSRRFKYVWNFTPEMEFKNVCVASKTFKSWQAKAESGDADAAEKVRRYQKRPGEELYDVTADPYEWRNIAENPEYAEAKAELRRELLVWMEDMGDLGQQTELEARKHQVHSRAKKKNAANK